MYLEGQMIINGRSVSIGPPNSPTGITEKRSPIQGGGEIVRTWNGAAVSTARASWWRWSINLSFDNAVLPPLLRESLWKGQLATIESCGEVVLDGYVDLAVTPRVAPPLTQNTVMWNPVPGSISFMTEDGVVDAGDGTNALPAGYTADQITQTVFRPILDCIVIEGFDSSLSVDEANYSGSVTLEEV